MSSYHQPSGHFINGSQCPCLLQGDPSHRISGSMIQQVWRWPHSQWAGACRPAAGSKDKMLPGSYSRPLFPEKGLQAWEAL